jgi:ubiquinone/menaquinone biosynthesis C-methylase UbiE
MGVYADQVLPRAINLMLDNKEAQRHRKRITAELRGEVIEIGFGSGLNVPYYPEAVTKVYAIDPATVGRKLAAERVESSPVVIDYVGLDGADLPLDSASVDAVLSTWTLCTIPGVEDALGEIMRVLRPEGRFHFLEHGRSPEDRVSAWQDRLNPIQNRLAGGCHLNREIDVLIRNAGFEVDQVDTFYLTGPRPMGFMYSGVATKPS